jgi:hypothetical protein
MILQQPRRAFRYAVPFLVALGVLSLAPPASAQVDTFVRFEEVATANWTVTEACPDGSTSTLRVSVLAGEEVEPDFEETFATVLIRGFDCEGNLVNDRSVASSVTYTSSPSLQEAHVSGTVLMRSGSVVTLDVTWEGTGPLETNVNQTQFDGFVGIFTSKERQAVATGTVVVDGQTVVSGSTTNASIETLEDRNRSLPSGE